MPDTAHTSQNEESESESERLNRELDQLLGALRVAPTAYHRLMFRERDKPKLVSISSKLALAGLVCLAVAMNGAVLLVTDVLFARTTAVVTAAATSTLFVALWFVLGLTRRIGKDRKDTT